MSLASQKLALYEVFCADVETGAPVSELDGIIDMTYRGEPRAGAVNGPIALTILTTGMGATDYRFAVTIYAHPDVDAIEAQDRIDAAVDVVESLMDAAQTWTRGDWTIGYNRELDIMAATLPTTCGREDF